MAETPEARLALVRALLLGVAPATHAGWRTVLAEAARVAVLEGLRASLADALPEAPDDVRDALDDARADAAVHAALSLRSAASICAACPQAVVVKGAALLAAGVLAPGARYASDVDVLVTREDAPAATRALAATGHRLLPTLRHDGHVRSGHEWPGGVWQAPGGATVDLHVVARPLAETQRCTTPHGEVRIPSNVAIAVGLCRHVERHHHDTRRGVLRHALDLRAVRVHVSAATWRTIVRDPHAARGVATLEALTRAAHAGDADALARTLADDRRGSVWRHAERSLRRALQIARHERSQLPWLIFPHPRYVRASRPGTSSTSLASAYARRLLGR